MYISRFIVTLAASTLFLCSAANASGLSDMIDYYAEYPPDNGYVLMMDDFGGSDYYETILIITDDLGNVEQADAFSPDGTHVTGIPSGGASLGDFISTNGYMIPTETFAPSCWGACITA